ncbi:hypothetical protein AAVH_16006, partial [Aphelenchoides avenae]
MNARHFAISHALRFYRVCPVIKDNFSAFSGIFENSPHDTELLGEDFKFKESMDLGETDFSAAEIRRLIQLLGREYRGDENHFNW